MSNVQKTKVEFEYDGFCYKLEYTAASLKEMEKNGFDFSAVEKNIITAPEELFCGSFIANHRSVPMAKRKEIYSALCQYAEDGANTINDAIIAMLSEAIDELTNRKGNVVWRVTK